MQNLSLDLNSLAGSVLQTKPATQEIRERLRLLLTVPQTEQEVDKLIEEVIRIQQESNAVRIGGANPPPGVDISRFEKAAVKTKFLILATDEIDYI